MQPSQSHDIIIVGGGITGAGLFRELAASGMRVLLIEQYDFAAGTSSRSSKLVHGGLRYLKQGALHLTRDSVVHRERLMAELPGLVEPLDFLMPLYGKLGPSRLQMTAGLFLYDLMAGKRRHSFLSADNLTKQIPGIAAQDLTGGFRFLDAQVDDARLVMRLIQEGLASDKATALSYTKVLSFLKNDARRITGVRTKDQDTGETATHHARLVINATGAFAETLHPSPERGRHLRPLRGSHLIFSRDHLPLDAAISFLHPKDRRPVFLIPWEGALLLGTTDEDFGKPAAAEPVITTEETRYLLEAVCHVFPDAGFTPDRVLSTFAGIRPVLSDGKKDPSAESREHVVWQDKGLVTVTGGKMTTFRKLAWDTLKIAARQIPMPPLQPKAPVVPPTRLSPPAGVDTATWQRLCGRYGVAASRFHDMQESLLTPIPGTRHLWGEIPLIAQTEPLRHLDDLLLRRLRFGILLANGGLCLMDRVQELAAPHLPWEEATWASEIQRYETIWKRAHAPRTLEPV